MHARLFDGQHVDLVVHVQALDVLAVACAPRDSAQQASSVSGVCALALRAFNDVDELVDRGVLAEEHLRVVDAILCGGAQRSQRKAGA